MTTVIIHYDKDGDETIFTDGDAMVLTVDERAPSDRVYRRKVEFLSHEEMDDLIGDCTIGHINDGSPAQARAETLVNGGKPALEIVK